MHLHAYCTYNPYRIIQVPSLASNVLRRLLVLVSEIESLTAETKFCCAEEGEVRTWRASRRSCSLRNGNMR